MKTLMMTAAALSLIATPALADPDVHTVTLPDGSTLTTVSDTNSQLWGPSSNQRTLVHCAPACEVVQSEVNSYNFLQGIWGAIGEGVRRPTRVHNSTNVSNGNSNSNSASAENSNANVAVNETDVRVRNNNEQGQGQLQGQYAEGGQGGRGGAAYAEGGDAFQAQGQIQGQYAQGGDANAEATATGNGGQGGSGGNSGNGNGGGNGNNGNCGNNSNSGSGNGNGNSCRN